MAWTVKIKDIAKTDNYLIVRVVLDDGTRKIFPDEYHITTELQLKRLINADIARLSQSDIDFPKLVAGNYDPTIPGPTAEEIAKTEYAINIALYRHMLAAITLGIKSANDQDVTDQQLLLKNSFTNSYLDLF